MTFSITQIRPQTLVSEKNIFHADACTVLALPDGYVNVWNELNISDLSVRVYQQRFDANGGALGSKTIIQNGGLAVSGYYVTLLTSGDYVLTWLSYSDPNSTKIYQRIFDLNGNPKTVDILVEDIPDKYFNSEITVTAFADGKYSISWHWDDFWDGEIDDEIYHRVFNSNGESVKTDVFDGNIFNKPGILALANGGYAVAWQSREKTPNTSNHPIYLRIHDTAGNAIGGDLIVDPNSLIDPKLTITALADGKSVLTWLSDRNLDGAQEIYQRLLAADGKSVGAESLVKDTTFAIQGSPEITALNDGGYVVVWERYFGGGGGIFKRQYDANGVATEPETLISAPGDSNARRPKITALANGKYIVTWDSGYEAYQQLCDPSGKRIGDAILLNDERLSFIDSITPTALSDGSHVVTWDMGGTTYQRFFDSELFPTLTIGRDWALGTEGSDFLSISPQTLTAGDILEALGGYDTLQLDSAGFLDLRAATTVSSFEVLNGSTGDDVIATSIPLISSFSNLDLGSGFDVLQLTIEGNSDLRALPQLNGLENIQVHGSDADDTIIFDLRFGSLLAIDLGHGDDRITWSIAGTYNLQGTKNVEEIKGTIRDDVLIVDWAVLSSGTVIDLDRGSDILELAGGGTFRLSSSLLAGIERFVVSNDSTTKVIGTELQDVVVGGTGQDHIVGGAGKDQLSGGSGDDRLGGGSDGDRLTGGKGKDAFIFASRPGLSNVDTITDFNVRDDTIWLDNAVFRKVGKGTMAKPVKLKSDAFVIGKKAKDAEDRIIYDKATGRLSYDPDGTGSASAVKFAQIKKGFALKSADFFVI